MQRKKEREKRNSKEGMQRGGGGRKGGWGRRSLLQLGTGEGKKDDAGKGEGVLGEDCSVCVCCCYCLISHVPGQGVTWLVTYEYTFDILCPMNDPKQGLLTH